MKKILYTLFTLLTLPLAHASQTEPLQFKVMALRVPSPGQDDVNMVTNLSVLVQQQKPDVLCLNGPFASVDSLYEQLERASYDGCARITDKINDQPIDKHSLMFRQDTEVKRGNTTACVYLTEGKSYPLEDVEYRVPKDEYGEPNWGGTTHITKQPPHVAAVCSSAYFHEYSLCIFSLDLGSQCPLGHCAGLSLNNQAQSTADYQKGPQQIYAGPFNATAEHLQIIKDHGLLHHANADMLLLGAPDFSEFRMDRRSVQVMLGRDCTDVFYTGKFRNVQSYLLPINPAGVMYQNFELDLFEDGTGEKFPLAAYLPVVTVFEVEKKVEEVPQVEHPRNAYIRGNEDVKPSPENGDARDTSNVRSSPTSTWGNQGSSEETSESGEERDDSSVGVRGGW